jgi:multiple sugar transport system permease protein
VTGTGGPRPSRLARLFSRRALLDALTYAASAVTALIFMAPILWAIDLSLKTRTDIFAWPPALIDFSPTLANFRSVFAPSGHFVAVLVNSVEVALLSTVVAVGAGASAAFAMSGRRAERRQGGADWLALSLLVFRMIPPVALVIPYYVVFKAFGLIGTRAALVISHSAFALAVVVFILKGFFDEIPREIEEAAVIDGVTPFQVFRLIIIPISKAALAASCIFAFLVSWNEFLFVSLLSSAATQTLPVAVSGFINEVYTSWGELAAATVVGVIPALLFSLFGQRFLLAGLAAGAVK